MIATANTRTNHLAVDDQFAETCWCTRMRHARARDDWCHHYTGDRSPETGSCRSCERMILTDDPEFPKLIERLWMHDVAQAYQGLMRMAEVA